MDSDSVCWRLLGLMPATQRYRGHPCGIKTQDFTDFSEGGLRYHAGGIILDGRLLHNCQTDSNYIPTGRGLLGSTPATPRYRECPGGIKTQDFADLSGGGLRYHAGGTLLEGRLLHNHRTDSNSVCWRLLGSMPATRWYMLHICCIRT